MGDKEWQAESDAQTLIRAKEVQMNKKRYAKAMAWCKTKCAALEQITGEEKE